MKKKERRKCVSKSNITPHRLHQLKQWVSSSLSIKLLKATVATEGSQAPQGSTL